MISKQEYEMLCSFKDKTFTTYDDENENIYFSLINNSLITQPFLTSKAKITARGLLEIEEYERTLQRQQSENESLKTAKAANKIAEEANSKNFKLSIAALIVSGLSMLGTIVATVFAVIAFF